MFSPYLLNEVGYLVLGMVSVCVWWLVLIFLTVEVISSGVICHVLITSIFSILCTNAVFALLFIYIRINIISVLLPWTVVLKL